MNEIIFKMKSDGRSGGGRNLNIEALRVLMMFLIVCLHIGTRIVDFSELHDVGGLRHALIHGFRSVTFLGVSTFAFISGYYGIQVSTQLLFKHSNK